MSGTYLTEAVLSSACPRCDASLGSPDEIDITDSGIVLTWECDCGCTMIKEWDNGDALTEWMDEEGEPFDPYDEEDDPYDEEDDEEEDTDYE